MISIICEIKKKKVNLLKVDSRLVVTKSHMRRPKEEADLLDNIVTVVNDNILCS